MTGFSRVSALFMIWRSCKATTRITEQPMKIQVIYPEAFSNKLAEVTLCFEARDRETESKRVILGVSCSGSGGCVNLPLGSLNSL